MNDILSWLASNWVQLVIVAVLLEIKGLLRSISKYGIFSVWDLIFYDKEKSLSQYQIKQVRQHFGLVERDTP